MRGLLSIAGALLLIGLLFAGPILIFGTKKLSEEITLVIAALGATAWFLGGKLDRIRETIERRP